MRIQSDAASLVLLARNKTAASPTLVVTVGLLYDNEQSIVPMAAAQPWLQERFGDEPLDRGLKKTRGGFAVQGSAFPLTQGQATGMAVRVSVGQCSKTLHVHPPRRWEKTLVGYRAVITGPLEPLPMVGAHGYGGQGYGDNPRGMGYVAAGDEYDGVQLPAIETQTQGATDPWGVRHWAGLMPLPAQSDLRRCYLGNLDEQWKQHAPFLPLDTDPRWFDEVAQDQCIDSYWQGNEMWAVAGMHPRQAEVGGRLPGFRPRLFVERKDCGAAAIAETPLDLDTVWLFPDAERVLLLYRSELPVIDLDGEDIAALAVGCETSAERIRAKDEWVAHLWPKAPVKAPPVQAPQPQPDPMPALLATMQAALGARYKAFADIQQHVIQTATAVAHSFGQTIDTSLITRQTPDLAAAITAAAKAGPRPAFDPAALRAKIEQEIATAKAAGQANAERAAQMHGIDLQAVQSNIAAAAQSPSAKLSVPKSVAQLDLPAAQKAQLMAQINEGMAQVQATEAQVNNGVGKVLAELAAMRPKISSVSLPKLSTAWTRSLLEERHAAGEALSNERFVDLDLSGIDLSKGVLKKCVFERCNFAQARLSEAVLSECRFHDCDLGAADMQAAFLNKAFLQRCCLNGVNAAGANLSKVQMLESQGAGANFSAGQLSGAHFVDCTFSQATFKGAQMPLAAFKRCDLERVDMAGAILHKSQLDDCTLTDARLPGVQLQGTSWSRIEGSGVDLSAAVLSGWRLDQHCRLPGLRLDRANLTDASLQGAFLEGASLRAATLDRALLARCDLSDSDGYHLTALGADFTGSDLTRAKWQGANLMDSRLRKVRLEQTDLRGSNLFGTNTEGVTGSGALLNDTLLNRCRIREDLARV